MGKQYLARYYLAWFITLSAIVEERARARYDSRDVTSHFGFRAKTSRLIRGNDTAAYYTRHCVISAVCIRVCFDMQFKTSSGLILLRVGLSNPFYGATFSIIICLDKIFFSKGCRLFKISFSIRAICNAILYFCRTFFCLFILFVTCSTSGYILFSSLCLHTWIDIFMIYFVRLFF